MGRLLGIWVCLFAFALHAQSVGEAFARLYNFDFAGAHRALDNLPPEQENEPLTYITRASVFLFREMDRLGIMSTEFYADRGQRLRAKHFKPSPEVRELIFENLTHARQLAERRLASHPGDPEANFALSIAAAIETNYAAFVEKKRLAALPLARLSQSYALRALAADPGYHDAYLMPGVNEYISGSIPFLFRWMLRFEQVEGSKKLGIEHLQEVANSGRYLAPMAKIVLVTIFMREKRFEEARRLTAELAADYPENPLFQRELKKLEAKLSGNLKAG